MADSRSSLNQLVQFMDEEVMQYKLCLQREEDFLAVSRRLVEDWEKFINDPDEIVRKLAREWVEEAPALFSECEAKINRGREIVREYTETIQNLKCSIIRQNDLLSNDDFEIVH